MRQDIVVAEQIEARYGQRGFDYLGGGWEDLPIWGSAGAAIVVKPGARLLKAIRAVRAPTATGRF